MPEPATRPLTPRAERTGPVAGVLLAAGSSTRMGESNKMLLKIDGESLLRRAARRAVEAGLDAVVVVLGHDAERAAEELDGLAVRPAVNRDHAAGIVTSLRTGLAALPPEVVAAMVLLADMPFVGPEMMASLVALYRASEVPLVISDYEGVNAPPMLYDRSLFSELVAMDDGRCGKQVVKRHRHQASTIGWPAFALADLDTPEDAERVLAAVAAHQAAPTGAAS
jgi:molybdenum cofactor cytidylyltransferase